MKTPDYKARAAQAAENWNRLQAQKKSKKEEITFTTETNEKAIEQTVAELIEDMEVPKTSVKGIHIVKDQIAKEELRDIA